MFTLEDIKTAHGKVKSGSDFPLYIRDITILWVSSYTTFVFDGHVEYVWSERYSVTSGPLYDALEIAQQSDPEQFIIHLKAHQQWASDYKTFCNQCAETWIVKWIVDTNTMTCTYYNISEDSILVEKIPTV